MFLQKKYDLKMSLIALSAVGLYIFFDTSFMVSWALACLTYLCLK